MCRCTATIRAAPKAADDRKLAIELGATDEDVLLFARMNPRGFGERLFEKGSSSLLATMAKVRSTERSASDDGGTLVRIGTATYLRRRSDRATLEVEILEGDRAGQVFAQGVALGGGKREEMRRALFTSCGVPFDPT